MVEDAGTSSMVGLRTNPGRVWRRSLAASTVRAGEDRTGAVRSSEQRGDMLDAQTEANTGGQKMDADALEELRSLQEMGGGVRAG
jgi:hypothetical protein